MLQICYTDCMKDEFVECYQGIRIYRCSGRRQDLLMRIQQGHDRYYSEVNPFPVTSLREARSDLDMWVDAMNRAGRR